jgi:hypothetical protein
LHFLTGAMTFVPVTQSAAMDLLKRPLLGSPLWQWVGMRPASVLPIQLGFVLLGAMGTLAVSYRVSQRTSPARAFAATVPWALLTTILTICRDLDPVPTDGNAGHQLQRMIVRTFARIALCTVNLLCEY